MRRAGLLLVAAAACEREGPREVRSPRDALGQVVRCALDGVGDRPPAARFEGAMRQALRGDRARFATRAGSCETALETPGGAHACMARVRQRWAEMLAVVQRPGVDAIDQDVAVRRVGEAYADALRQCPE